ncbi:hypothetical protein [Paractinoplanes hotanensis]|uniref:Lipoprotein with Yx(FWY)xxD motif n=1 Tax=Paractinoplanes hotanensis TaxID=2906497 RepID=A0ABT0XXW2_9ACTN|nr:hypothetical protein [Actinoplanes hotanensis]MCM4078625.1 hypothetical protein [Actinoplanes hotanensis]
MARTSARAPAVSLAAATLFAVAACAGDKPAEPAGTAGAAAAGQIQLVDAPASSLGLTGDGRGGQPTASAEPTATVASPSAVPDTGSAAPSKWVQLSVNKASIGETVTEVRGFTLYRFAKDTAEPVATNCTGDCAVRWPPVLIQAGGRVFLDGLQTDEVGAIRRSDGGVQVTLGGRPVYRFADDTVPGDFNGQGVDNAWFAIKRDGSANDALIGTEVVKPAKPDRTATLTAKKGSDGAVVVDDDGATLYRNDEDSTDPPASKCTGACATLWRPVVAENGKKVKVVGIDEKRVWWLRREDGTKQVTLDGAPLYRNAADKSTGVVIASAAVQGWTPAR